MVREAGPAPAPSEALTTADDLRLTPIASLVHLLIELFSTAAGMRTFVRSYRGIDLVAQELPADTVSAATMADALAILLKQHNLVTREFFAALSQVRPFKADEIRRAAKAWEIQLDATAWPPKSPWRRRNRAVAGMLVAILCLVAVVVLPGELLPRSEQKLSVRTPPVMPPAGPPEGMLVVPPGSYFMGTADGAGALAACRSLYSRGCEAKIEREVAHSGWRTMGSFLLDETEVTTSDFAAWINREVAMGRAHIDPHHVRYADGQLLLTHNPARLEWRSESVPFIAAEGVIRPAPGMAAHPATLLTWTAAEAYCRHRGGRLPTEAEWEFSARGPDGRDYVWGDRRVSCRDVVHGRYGSQGATAACPGLAVSPDPVGRSVIDVSWIGARDLGANVSEWVADVGLAESCRGKEGEPGAVCHIFKGGSWADPLLFARPAMQFMFGRAPDDVAATIGFRCAKDLTSTP